MVFSEFKEKIDVTDDEGEDSLTYAPYDTLIFNREKSGNLSEDDYVTIINPLLVVSQINVGTVNKNPYTEYLVST